MPTFIKPGFWEKRKQGYDHWLNLDQLILGLVPSGGSGPLEYNANATGIQPVLGTNNASGSFATIGGGAYNTASNNGSAVSGGLFNTASNRYSTIGGGKCNISSGCTSTVSGGYNNIASGCMSAILGGTLNTTNTCANTMIVGSNITADRAYSTFVNNLSIKNIPTSAAGLPAGSVWKNGAVLNIV